MVELIEFYEKDYWYVHNQPGKYKIKRQLIPLHACLLNCFVWFLLMQANYNSLFETRNTWLCLIRKKSWPKSMIWVKKMNILTLVTSRLAEIFVQKVLNILILKLIVYIALIQEESGSSAIPNTLFYNIE